MARTDLREARSEARLCAGIRALGGLCPKFNPTGERGWPDRVVVMPGGRVYWVELKSLRGRLTPWQTRRHLELKALGQEVVTLHGHDQVDTFLERVRATT